jgi:hypothetical protein
MLLLRHHADAHLSPFPHHQPHTTMELLRPTPHRCPLPAPCDHLQPNSIIPLAVYAPRAPHHDEHHRSHTLRPTSARFAPRAIIDAEAPPYTRRPACAHRQDDAQHHRQPFPIACSFTLLSRHPTQPLSARRHRVSSLVPCSKHIREHIRLDALCQMHPRYEAHQQLGRLFPSRLPALRGQMLWNSTVTVRHSASIPPSAPSTSRSALHCRFPIAHATSIVSPSPYGLFP